MGAAEVPQVAAFGVAVRGYYSSSPLLVAADLLHFFFEVTLRSLRNSH